VLKKYLALLRASWQGTLEYRASILIYMLLASMPLVSLAVWLSLSADAPIGNYSSADFISYYLALIFARHMTGAWVSHELDYQIRQGTLSSKLLKPLNPIHEHIATHISDKLFRLPLVLTPITIAALLIPGVHFDLSPFTILFFLLSLVLTFAIIFVSTYCVGLLNFWITHADAVSNFEWLKDIAEGAAKMSKTKKSLKRSSPFMNRPWTGGLKLESSEHTSTTTIDGNSMNFWARTYP